MNVFVLCTGRCGSMTFARACGHIRNFSAAPGKDAFYVHLMRDKLATAESYNRRWGGQIGIMGAYSHAILMREEETLYESLDYFDTVQANIRLFLKDKPYQMTFHLENAAHDFPEFWTRIGAKGDLGAALGEWGIRHNASPLANAL